MFRRALKADGRRPWSELFFRADFKHPLSKEDAGDYAFSLEMLRLAPSATNSQPWRVLITDEAIHFFEKHSLGGESVGVDMQRIDVGIGICHFHLAAVERNLSGRIERRLSDLATVAVPQGLTYIASWIIK